LNSIYTTGFPLRALEGIYLRILLLFPRKLKIIFLLKVQELMEDLLTTAFTAVPVLKQKFAVSSGAEIRCANYVLPLPVQRTVLFTRRKFANI